jgi:hypothetical protein
MLYYSIQASHRYYLKHYIKVTIMHTIHYSTNHDTKWHSWESITVNNRKLAERLALQMFAMGYFVRIVSEV